MEPAETIEPTIERYSRGARRLHAAIYVAVLLDLATGWWFVLGGYRPSVIATATGVGDADVHEYAGLALFPVVLIGLVAGRRGVRTFAVESVRFRRSDLRWFAKWPRSLVSGRFAYHDGHFDPGQRLANLFLVSAIATLMVTGVALLYTGGIVYQMHHWAAFLITPVLLGHILVASGLFPGYRGVWRSMHRGGRLPVDVARRIWPAWLERRSRR
jgi:cytochrome b subunit of formate dehydrogenase